MKTYYIPNGPKNLATLFPTIDFSTLKQYYLKIRSSDNTVIATAPINRMDGKSCCEDKIRLRYLTYCGTIDGMNFQLILKEHEAKSDVLQKPSVFPLVKTSHALTRFNVKANDTLTLSNIDYGESDMAWVSELIDSPLCWIEWKGTQTQPDSYIPVIIVDSKIQTVKQEERFVNEITLQVKLSNEKYIIRN